MVDAAAELGNSRRSCRRAYWARIAPAMCAYVCFMGLVLWEGMRGGEFCGRGIGGFASGAHAATRRPGARPIGSVGWAIAPTSRSAATLSRAPSRPMTCEQKVGRWAVPNRGHNN